MNLQIQHISFGQYAQVHDGTDNTAKPRSIYGIALYQQNDRGGYAFMNLDTGCVVHANTWTQLPITDAVSKRVETIGTNMIMVDELIKEIDQSLKSEILNQVQRQALSESQDKQNQNEH